MITKKHALIIAVAFSRKLEQLDDPYDEPIRELAIEIADEFKSDNPKFDREKFLKSCGIYEG